MNPMMAFMQMMKGGGNPQAMLNQLMGNSQIASNPMAANAMEMFQSGNIDGLKSLAENLAKEKGQNIEDIKNGILQQFGMR